MRVYVYIHITHTLALGLTRVQVQAFGVRLTREKKRDSQRERIRTPVDGRHTRDLAYYEAACCTLPTYPVLEGEALKSPTTRLKSITVINVRFVPLERAD